MGKYSDEISFIPSFNGGVYYLKNTEVCKHVFEIAKDSSRHYYDYSFNGFKEPADEPVLALGMAVCGCWPLNRSEFVFAPKPKEIELDIVSGTAISMVNKQKYRLVHWSNFLTEKSIYRFEVWHLHNNYNLKHLSAIRKLMKLYDIRVSPKLLTINAKP